MGGIAAMRMLDHLRRSSNHAAAAALPHSLDPHVELGQIRRLSDDIERADLSAPKGEQECGPDLPPRCPHGTGLTVDESRHSALRPPLEDLRNFRCATYLGCQSGGTVLLATSRHVHRRLIGAQDDVRREYGEQAVEIPVPRRRQKGATSSRCLARLAGGACAPRTRRLARFAS